MARSTRAEPATSAAPTTPSRPRIANATTKPAARTASTPRWPRPRRPRRARHHRSRARPDQQSRGSGVPGPAPRARQRRAEQKATSATVNTTGPWKAPQRATSSERDDRRGRPEALESLGRQHLRQRRARPPRRRRRRRSPRRSRSCTRRRAACARLGGGWRTPPPRTDVASRRSARATSPASPRLRLAREPRATGPRRRPRRRPGGRRGRRAPSAHASWCVVSRTAAPAATRSASTSRSSACDGGSSPTTGSSSTSTSAGRTSAQASIVFWRMPRDSSRGRKSARAAEPEPAEPVDRLDLAAHAVRERHQLEVLADGEVVVEQRRVGHERERGAGGLGVGLAVWIVTADAHGAGARLEQARDRAHGGRLAAAVGADERHALTGGDVQIEAGQRHEPPVARRRPSASSGAMSGRGSAHLPTATARTPR